MNDDSCRQDRAWMSRALALAERAEALGEVPVGAVLVSEGRVLGEGFNTMIRDRDPSAHAEINVLRMAGRAQDNYRLPGSTLYVTLEPCSMCAGAIVLARVERVVFAASYPRTGAAGSVFQILDHPDLNHRCRVEGGLMADASSTMLKAFFRQRRGAAAQ
jgi:tRNA(adenine34) deaminase